jgi:alkanesulfonate monooxygenase
LFWGDTVAQIAENMKVLRGMAAKHGREQDLGFGMRLQIVCREKESDAWEFADSLIRNVTKERQEYIRTYYAGSAANRRVQELARRGDLIAPHLWTGLTKARPGAGIVIVGNPEQCANTLQEFIDIGCHSFCLSGYLHDEECDRFNRLVRPILADRNRSRMAV